MLAKILYSINMELIILFTKYYGIKLILIN